MNRLILKNFLFFTVIAGIAVFAGGCDHGEVTPPDNKVPVSSVTLDKTDITLTVGEDVVLVANVKPDNATDKAVTWLSSNEKVAMVSSSGKVLAVSAGNATVTAKAGNVSASCAVTVKEKNVEVTSITLDKSGFSLTEGESLTLVATVKPDNATDKTVTWSTSDAAVATVDNNGKVTAVKKGTTAITAKAGNVSASCSITVLEKVIEVTSITLDKSSLSLTEGETLTLVATVKPDNATDKTVTWSSSDAAVASVDDNGKVTAVKKGTATITAKAGNISASCAVTVKEKIVEVTSITLDKSNLSLTEGEYQTLVATVKPDNATDKTVTWSSSNSAVASVDNNGKATAVKKGTATITAKAGNVSATCTVTVKEKIIDVTSVTLDKSSLSLTEGEYQTLVATVKPDNATDKTVTWTSSNSAVASVDGNGKVTAVKKGTATITAKAGNVKATCTVTVKEKIIDVTSVTLDKSSLSLTEGEYQTLVATVKPDNATDKTVTWTSSNSAVASVDGNGKVTAVKKGTATITAKAGNASATCTVTVKEKIIDVSSVTLDKSSLSLTEGEYQTLVATVKPDNATDKTVTWTSSNSAVASVDNNGKVTAVKEGTATITAKAGNAKSTCAVTVVSKDVVGGGIEGTGEEEMN